MARAVGSHAGQLDRRVTFRRRATLPSPQAGNVRGDYADWFTVWGGFRALSSRESVISGLDVDVVLGDLIVRDTARTREVTAADRVRISGQDFAVASVPPPDRTGYLTIRVQRGIGG